MSSRLCDGFFMTFATIKSSQIYIKL